MKTRIYEVLQGDGCHIGFFSTIDKAVTASIDFLNGAKLTVSVTQIAIAKKTLRLKGEYTYRFIALDL